MTNIVYLASSGHSGSTALGSLLGTSSEIEMLGEVGRIREAITSKRCSCLLPLLSCPVWGDVWRRRRKWIRRRPFGRTLIENPRLFDTLESDEPRRILLDTSKNTRRLRVLHAQGLRPKVLWLKRNGLAVINSPISKGKAPSDSETVLRLARSWAMEQQAIRSVLSETGLYHLEVNLEALEPTNAEVWNRMRAFLGVGEFPLDTLIDPRRQHQLDGNSIRKGDPFRFLPPKIREKEFMVLAEQIPHDSLGAIFWSEMQEAGYA